MRQKQKYVSCYFEPSKSAYENIIGFIQHCKKSLDICAYYLTNDTITQLILVKKNQGVKIRILCDAKKSKSEGSDIKKLLDNRINVKVDNSGVNLMHNKFLIGDKKAIMTGSFNFTMNALKNAENIVIIRLSSIVKDYLKEFNRLWEQGK